ncbi:MAG: glutathione peroxidase [Terrimicrobiaceae bacterium]|nr:glutathione peroxidase [Terrimicrobiaceae bacterium]
MLKLPFFAFIACALAGPSFAAALVDIPFKTTQGADTSLKASAGKPVLIVNVASRCGNTPQYAGLEQLYKKYGPRGLVILGFPCNDFGGQEPGTAAEIQQFCTQNYGVTFPILAKLHVKGPEQHPLYAALTGPGAKFPGDVKWNFGKFLIGKDGAVLVRFEPGTKPDDPAVIAAIESALE